MKIFPFDTHRSMYYVLVGVETVHKIFLFFQVFVFFLSFLVTLQQALSSGYINSVITTIEKRFEIPSSLSGLIASSYEIGNVITVIFVSYLGSRRHIPVWIAVGKNPYSLNTRAVSPHEFRFLPCFYIFRYYKSQP